MMENVVLFDRVSKAFGAKEVLRGVDLSVGRGETVAILGASGSGKTVSLKLVNGLLRPEAGRIETLGYHVSDLTERELLPLRVKVSYLFQGGALFDSMTVFENIAFPILEHTEPSSEALRSRIAALLGLVRLEGIEALYPSELSGGMRKRVALARALALEPEIILYDEPTTGLDPVTGLAIAELMRELHSSLHVTSIVVTHDIPLVLRVATRVVFLHEGRFVYSGTVKQAATESPEPVRRFFEAGGAHA